MSLTLIGRLLCAAQQTYDIVVWVTPLSPPQPTPPPSSLVGWLGDVPCQVGGDQQINAVMVGETASEVIVAFRGTEPFDSPDKARMILDWIDDLLVDQVPAPRPGPSTRASTTPSPSSGTGRWRRSKAAPKPSRFT